MPQFYKRKIKDGTITLEGVQLLWRKQVEELLKKEAEKNE